MNNAIFAIPGLMPPKAPNWRSKIVTPEDGSLCMCVHCGRTGDEVNYAIFIGGWRYGVIKDPSYNYGCDCSGVGFREYMTRKKYPQFMTISETLPPNAIVPMKVIRDWPIPITERPDIPDADKLYWIINLPMRTLPVGDSEVQAVVNGKVHTWYIQRPVFEIHNWNDATNRFKCFNHQDRETLDVSFVAGKEDTIILDIISCCGCPEVLEGAEYRASITIHGTTSDLSTSASGNELTITVPPQTPGYGLWEAEYKVFDDWLQLAAGDIVITPTQTT